MVNTVVITVLMVTMVSQPRPAVTQPRSDLDLCPVKEADTLVREGEVREVKGGGGRGGGGEVHVHLLLNPFPSFLGVELKVQVKEEGNDGVFSMYFPSGSKCFSSPFSFYQVRVNCKPEDAGGVACALSLGSCYGHCEEGHLRAEITGVRVVAYGGSRWRVEETRDTCSVAPLDVSVSRTCSPRPPVLPTTATTTATATARRVPHPAPTPPTITTPPTTTTTTTATTAAATDDDDPTVVAIDKSLLVIIVAVMVVVVVVVVVMVVVLVVLKVVQTRRRKRRAAAPPTVTWQAAPYAPHTTATTRNSEKEGYEGGVVGEGEVGDTWSPHPHPQHPPQSSNTYANMDGKRPYGENPYEELKNVQIFLTPLPPTPGETRGPEGEWDEGEELVGVRR